ncbi:MAG: hypothetical protein ACXABV_09150 [Candidatus Thorarchaeota archaeon]
MPSRRFDVTDAETNFVTTMQSSASHVGQSLAFETLVKRTNAQPVARVLGYVRNA